MRLFTACDLQGVCCRPLPILEIFEFRVDADEYDGLLVTQYDSFSESVMVCEY